MTKIQSLNFTKKYTPHEAKKKDAKNDAKDNILHKAPVRYIGYSDDIGAAANVLCANSKSALIKKLPALSYIPVGLYITADVGNTFRISKKTDDTKTATKKAAHQAIFQLLTSVLLPVATIGAVQKLAGKGFDKFIPTLKQQFDANGAKIVNRKRDIALVATGLGALFGLSKPTDKFADKFLMEKIVDPLLGLDRKSAKKLKASNDMHKTKSNKKISTKLGTTQG